MDVQLGATRRQDPRCERRKMSSIATSRTTIRRALGSEPAVQGRLRERFRDAGGEPWASLRTGLSHNASTCSGCAIFSKNRLGLARANLSRRRSEYAWHGFLAGLTNQRDIGTAYDTPDYAPGKARRFRETAATSLCMPRVMVAPAYARSRSRVEEFA